MAQRYEHWLSGPAADCLFFMEPMRPFGDTADDQADSARSSTHPNHRTHQQGSSEGTQHHTDANDNRSASGKDH